MYLLKSKEGQQKVCNWGIVHLDFLDLVSFDDRVVLAYFLSTLLLPVIGAVMLIRVAMQAAEELATVAHKACKKKMIKSEKMLTHTR